jgi:hypothetical protein
LYEKAHLLRYPPTARVGPLDPGVKEALHALEFAGRAPREVALIGVVPESAAMSLQLAPTIQAAVRTAVVAIEITLARFGTSVERRPLPKEVATTLFPTCARSLG